MAFDRFALLPIAQEIVSSAFDGLVFRDDFLLQTRHLRLNRRILALDYFVERAPFAFQILHVKPVGGKLETLPLENSLTFSVYFDLNQK